MSRLATSGSDAVAITQEKISTLSEFMPPLWFAAVVLVFTALTVVLSYWPVRNMLGPHQRMNASFNPYHLVNTYGAFGSIGRVRHEVVIEGTDWGRTEEPPDGGSVRRPWCGACSRCDRPR